MQYSLTNTIPRKIIRLTINKSKLLKLKSVIKSYKTVKKARNATKIAFLAFLVVKGSISFCANRILYCR